MPTLTDYRIAAYVDAGFTGTVDDAEFAYLRDAGYTGSLDDMRKQLYADAGFTDEKDYWLDRGYTGAIGDMGLEAGIANDYLPGGGGALPGEIALFDTFTDVDGSMAESHTPNIDINLPGSTWQSAYLGAVSTSIAAIASGMTTQQNTLLSGSVFDLGGLPLGISFTVDFLSASIALDNQFFLQKIGRNLYAHILRVKGNGTNLTVTFGVGGTNTSGVAFWHSQEGTWTTSQGIGSRVTVTAYLDRDSDVVHATIGEESRVFDLKQDTYTQLNGLDGTHVGWVMSNTPYRNLDDFYGSRVGT